MLKLDGDLKPKKGINCPDLKLGLSAVTEKDAKYILEQKLEFVALSFVQEFKDIEDLIAVFEKYSGPITEHHHTLVYKRPLIIAKIEKPQAFDQINEIIKAAGTN